MENASKATWSICPVFNRRRSRPTRKASLGSPHRATPARRIAKTEASLAQDGLTWTFRAASRRKSRRWAEPNSRSRRLLERDQYGERRLGVDHPREGVERYGARCEQPQPAARASTATGMADEGSGVQGDGVRRARPFRERIRRSRRLLRLHRRQRQLPSAGTSVAALAGARLVPLNSMHLLDGRSARPVLQR